MEQKPHYIEESHQTCQHIYGLDRDDIPFPKSNLIRQVLYQKQAEYQDFLTVSRHFITKLLQFMEGTPTLIMISDNLGYLLEMYGDPTIESKVHTLGIYEGSLFVEKDVGTNSLSLALKLNRPIQLIGTDHYHYCLHSIACLTAPFSNHDSTLPTGTISIMTTVEYASSFHLGLLSSAVDSIERELKIREQNKRLNLLHQVMVDSTRSGIVITDTQGFVTDYNAVGEEITGFPKHEVVNQPIDVLEPLSPYMKQVLKQGCKFENLEVMFPALHSDEIKICLIDALPIYDENQYLIGAFGQFKDITGRIKLQNQLIAAEKLSFLGELGAGFAHEIRNPLSSIIGFIELMKTDKDNPSEHHLTIISSELERIKRLVNQFVMMAKPRTKVRKLCKITTLIKDTAYLMEHQSGKEHVKLKVVSDQEWELPIDESQIKQVLMNLIQNAFDAIQLDGTIQISLSEKKRGSTEFIQIAVEDDGDGMTNDQMANVFNPFYTTKENGLGLGLSICKQIIESHNGKMNVTSVKNKGTIFHILLRK